MDIESLLSTIEEISKELYPDVPEVAKLCHAIMIWERSHISVATPRYKEPFLKFLKGVEKRYQARLAKEKEGGES